jgi:iron complex transport system ATP-binding protein
LAFDVDNPRGAEAAPASNSGPGRETHTESYALSLEDLSIRYPGAPGWAVRGVTLCVREGDVVALLGANGAGKSTLLRAAAGLTSPTGGRVRVAGVDLGNVSRRTLARSVALVAQSEAVPAGFRVREVVAMGRAPHQGTWMRETERDRAAIDEALAGGSLGSLADRSVETLSGGELRRVAVARAVAQKPRVLLLDEPAAFMDVRHRLELHEQLARIASRERVACLVAMHDLDSAARFASSALLLRAGRVIASGPPAEVLTPARLREAFDAEIGVGHHAPSGTAYFVPVRAVGSAPP